MTEPDEFDRKLREYLQTRTQGAADAAVGDRLVKRAVDGDARRHRLAPFASVVLAFAVIALVGAPTTVILLHRGSHTPSPHRQSTAPPLVTPAPTPNPTAAPTPTPTPGPGTPPSPWRWGSAFASGPGLPLILYGGQGDGVCTWLFDTYVWDGSRWSLQHQTGGPQLVSPTLGWDPVGRRMLLVGEPPTCAATPDINGQPEPSYLPPQPTETWAWVSRSGLSGAWVRLNPAHEPDWADEPSTATDTVGHQLFLLVRDQGVDTDSAKAWTWDGNDWTERASSSVCSPVNFAAGCPLIPFSVVTAPGGGVVGLCGITTGTALCKLSGSNWSVEPGTQANAIFDATIWNPVTSHIVAIGYGYAQCPSPCGRALYTFNGSSWTMTPIPAQMQTLRGEFEFGASSGSTTQLVLWGGSSGYSASPPFGRIDQTDTWTYDGNIWTRAG